jgi:hypothetical protein
MNLIVSSIAETQMTGLLFAAEKSLRSVNYRAELFAGEPLPRMFKNGRRLSHLDANTTLVNLANELTRFFNRTVHSKEK